MKYLLRNIEWSKGFHSLPSTLCVEIESSLTGEDAYCAALEAAEYAYSVLAMDEDDDTPVPTCLHADVSSLEDAIDLLDHALARAYDAELYHVVAELETELNKLMQYQYE